MELHRSYAIPQTQTSQFIASLKTKQIGVHLPSMTNDQAAQHLDLLCFAGQVTFKGDMLGQVLDSLPAVPVFL